VTSQQIDDVTTAYNIDQPIVTRATTDYPMIQLLPGDVVTVTASGCAQTGGDGHTWKDYVLPFPFEEGVAGRYHGTVTIPGATNLGTPIYSVQGKPITVPVLPETDSACVEQTGLHLQLGYTDDQYDDNGYSAHDDGVFDQCAEDSIWPFANHGKPAQVQVVVQHAVPGAFYLAQAYDVVPACVDQNYLFMDPRWGWQNGSPVAFEPAHPATTQATEYDNPDAWKQLTGLGFLGAIPFVSEIILVVELFKGFLCKVDKGHRNWSDVTYAGRVSWQEKSPPFPFGDDDYNIKLWTNPVGSSGFAEGGLIRSPHNFVMEFDSDETIDEFTGADTWWRQLKGAVDASDEQAASLIDGHLAIATGLMGIDEIYDANAGNEIHPLHALAIHLDRIALDATHFRDKWALFVRNSGNEGECASLDHYLLLNQYTMRISPTIDRRYANLIDPTGTTISRGNLHANWSQAQTPSYYVVPDDPAHPDLLLTVNLKDPPDHSWFVGDFDVDWTVTQPLPPDAFLPLVFLPDGSLGPVAGLAPAASLEMVRGSSLSSIPDAPSDEDTSPEALLASVRAALNPDQHAEVLRLYQALAPVRPVPEVVNVGVTRVDQPPVRPESVPQVDIGPPPAWQLFRQLARIRALCATTRGHVPFAPPDACEKVGPLTLLETSGGATGKNGWIVTPLTVKLTALDASGAGIDHTEYGFDGTNYVLYTGPFILPEGQFTLYYRSRDLAGQFEIPSQRAFQIDTRPPTSDASSSAAGGGVTLTYSVNDPVPGSGPASLHAISRGPNGAQEHLLPAAQSGTATFDTLCTDVEYWGEDVAGNEEHPHKHTPDATPPVLVVQPDAACLWPPDHRRVAFRLGSDVMATASDACDPAPAISVVSVTSSEPDNGLGDGDTAGDVSFGLNAICVRRERSGTGPGRTYTATIEATDYSGNRTHKQVVITVPHSQEAGCGVAGTVIPEGSRCE
jgi:hypothetical protein